MSSINFKSKILLYIFIYFFIRLSIERYKSAILYFTNAMLYLKKKNKREKFLKSKKNATFLFFRSDILPSIPEIVVSLHGPRSSSTQTSQKLDLIDH